MPVFGLGGDVKSANGVMGVVKLSTGADPNEGGGCSGGPIGFVTGGGGTLNKTKITWVNELKILQLELGTESKQAKK